MADFDVLLRSRAFVGSGRDARSRVLSGMPLQMARVISGRADPVVFADDFSTRATGPLGLAVTGQAWQTDVNGQTNSVAAISGGLMVSPPGGGSFTNSYSGVDLLDDVACMYAEQAFQPGTLGNQSAVLIATQTVKVTSIIFASIHVQFQPERINVQYFVNNVTTTVTITYPQQIPLDGVHRLIGWRRVGTSLFVLGADGIEREVIAAQWPTKTGTAAMFEHTADAGGGLVTFARVWAAAAPTDVPNLLTAPKLISDASWAKTNIGSITENVLGTFAAADAETILESSATGGHSWRQVYTKTATALRYRQSVLVKPVGRTWVQLLVGDNPAYGQSALAYYDLAAGAVGTVGGTGFGSIEARMVSAGNGFTKLTLDFTTTTGTDLGVNVGIATANGVTSYAGDTTKGLIVTDHRLQRIGS